MEQTFIIECEPLTAQEYLDFISMVVLGVEAGELSQDEADAMLYREDMLQFATEQGE